jgi:hypothetical protein
MIKVSDETCRENQTIYFMFKKFFSPILDVYDLMWKNMVQPDRSQMIIYYGPSALHAG